jgi:hypothetical protein
MNGKAFGLLAKHAASDLAFGKEVSVQTYGLDKYGRTIADVLLSDGTHAGQRRLVLVVSEVCAEGYGAGRVREGLFDLNKKPVIPDNTVYQIQRQLLSDPTRGFSFEGAPSHTHFGLAKNKWPAPLSRTSHLLFGLS